MPIAKPQMSSGSLGRFKGGLTALGGLATGNPIGLLTGVADLNPDSAGSKLLSMGKSLFSAMNGDIGGVTGQRGAQGQANLGVNTNLGVAQAPKFDYSPDALGRRLKNISRPSLLPEGGY